MIEYELIQSKHDETLFFDQKRRLYVTIYVNDIKIFASINQKIDELSNYLKIKYEMINLRDVKWYLKMKITRLLSKNQDQNRNDQKRLNENQTDQENQNQAQNEVILLTQTKYIRDLLLRHGMKECALVVTSMTEVKLKKAFSGYKCFEK
jgi:hypothetical protein